MHVQMLEIPQNMELGGHLHDISRTAIKKKERSMKRISKISVELLYIRGSTLWRSWLRHCATSRKVAGSISNGVIGIFYWHNPSGRTMAKGFTQPLTEMSKLKVKWSRYRPGVAQRVGRGIALLFHDHGTRRMWVVSSTPRPDFTPVKDPVPILQEAWWAPGPVWTGGKCRSHRVSIPDRPALSSVAIPTELPAHNRNEYQEYVLGVKAAGV